MNVKIDKLSKNENTFNSKLPLEGEMAYEPKVGKSFFVFGGEFGGLKTSTIQKVKETDEGWILTTLNSVYEVTRLEE